MRRLEEMVSFLEGKCLAVMATIRQDGTPLLSPVWYEYRDGGFVVVVDKGDTKDRHLMRDPRLTLVIAEQAFPYRGVEARGQAELGDEGASEATRRMAYRYLVPAAAESYLKKTESSSGRLVWLRPSSVRAWDFLDYRSTISPGAA
jgi:PPOX class probable F420-dependent enzyme